MKPPSQANRIYQIVNVHKYKLLYNCLFQMKLSQLRQLGRFFQTGLNQQAGQGKHDGFHFQPTTFLSHPFLQSVYNLAEPRIPVTYEREKMFFDDGGHIALDWSPRKCPATAPPVLFVMHGLTGGSEMNYIRALTEEATKEGYQCVCLNSRGINTDMSSPIPFTALEYNQLNFALERVESEYPRSPIYLVGTSFGGNYLIRYLVNNSRPSIAGLVALAPPFDVKKVVDDMSPIYQRFFVKRYIYETVRRHPEMKYWQDIGLVDLKEVERSTNLREFHGSITAKILGYSGPDYLFEQYAIKGEQIKQLNVNTLLIVSKDDPIVSYQAMPHEEILENKKIKFVATDKGGHLCWYEGIVPKRWYPRPVLNYLRSLREAS